jgi:alginate O-acetyltransferase complex protein AlgJ
VLESRARRLGELGISHHFLVVPNKESIYAEYLPAGLPSARERPVHQLVNHLAAARSPVSIVYPEPEMRAAKQRWPLFPKGDTHWNGLGGYVAYRALAEAVAKDVPVQVVELEDLECVRWAELGDLSEKLVPPEPAVKLMARVRNFRARLVYNNRVRNTGRILAFEREDLEGPTCMMFGDSFAWTLFTYLAESFPRFVFVHRPTLDYDVIELERPGLVLSELIERFLIAVPDDDNAPSTAELEESKRLRNQVMSDDEALSFARYFDPDFRSVHVHWSSDLDAVAASVDR